SGPNQVVQPSLERALVVDEIPERQARLELGQGLVAEKTGGPGVVVDVHLVGGPHAGDELVIGLRRLDTATLFDRVMRRRCRCESRREPLWIERTARLFGHVAGLEVEVDVALPRAVRERREALDA